MEEIRQTTWEIMLKVPRRKQYGMNYRSLKWWVLAGFLNHQRYEHVMDFRLGSSIAWKMQLIWNDFTCFTPAWFI